MTTDGMTQAKRAADTAREVYGVRPSEQLRLDDWHPGSRPARARRGDPLSSHAAADRAERSGTISRQCATAVGLVEAHPGRTSRELADLGPLDRYQLARRLTEAERKGAIVATMRAGEELRWWPAGKAPQGAEVLAMTKHHGPLHLDERSDERRDS